MVVTRALAWLGVSAALLVAGSASATVRVATGLDLPVALTAAPGDTGRVFIAELHTGRIRILRLSDRALLSTPFLTVPGVTTDGDQGLLGLAFDPNYAANGYFYVRYTDPDNRVVRYRVSAGDPNLADSGSATPVIQYPQPATDHDGGWIGFGPDGYLYIATGDGGAPHDSGPGHTTRTGHAQDLTDN